MSIATEVPACLAAMGFFRSPIVKSVVDFGLRVFFFWKTWPSRVPLFDVAIAILLVVSSVFPRKQVIFLKNFRHKSICLPLCIQHVTLHGKGGFRSEERRA